MSPSQPTTHPKGAKAKRRIFLRTLAKTCNVTESAAAAGVCRKRAYEWREAHAEFAKAWDDAIETATDALEAEARRRAIDGWEEPVHYQGIQTSTIRKYSDALLALLLRGRRRTFRENHAVELTGANGGPVQVQTLADVVRRAAAAKAAKTEEPKP